MAEKKIITFGGRDVPFKGIDRTASSNDSNPGSARVLRDMEIDPVGKLVLRDEYDTLYDDRPSQYEHTTDDTNDEQEVKDITNTHESWRSHRRKMVAVTNNGTDEYVFTGYCEQSASSGDTELFIHRGKRGTTDITFPADGGADEPLRICGVDDLNGNGYHTNDWIEFSFVSSMSSGSNATHVLYIAVTLCDSQEPETQVRFYKVTDLYNADFGNATVSVIQTGGNDYITTEASSSLITRDIDIEIGTDNGDGDGYNGDRLFFFWGYDPVGGSANRFDYTSTADLTDIDSFTGSDDLYAGSIVIDTSVTASNSLYLTYTDDTTLYYQLFVDSGVGNKLQASGNPVEVATGIYNGASLDFYYGACFAIDGDGAKHWLYRTAEYTLTHNYQPSGGAVQAGAEVTDTLSSVTEVLNTGWDLVVKDGLVTVFYAYGTADDKIYKRVRIVDSGDEDYNSGSFYAAETVRADPNDYAYRRYFGCYRKYEINVSKRLSYIIGSNLTTNVTLRYLHSDKGFFDADFDDDITSEGDRQVTIEAHREALIDDADGTMTQVLVLQCDDNKLYKRGDYQWVLLEGQRNVDNTGWNWTTDYGGRANIWDLNGTMRFNAGNGASNQNVWYGGIFDRYFFVNTTTHRYNDHYSQLARLDPMPISYVDSIIEIEHDDAPDGYCEFVDIAGQHGFTRITHKYKLREDGNPETYAEFYFAFSLEYDGYQESQLRVQDSDTTYEVGFLPFEGGWRRVALLKVKFEIPVWNKVSSPLNTRITAINIYMGEPTSDDDTKLTVQYDWVKRVQVSATKKTGEDPFGTGVADDIKGEKEWTVNAGDSTLYYIETYIDYNHWMGRQINGAVDRLGNSNVLYESTGSGSEVYTKNTFIPEGFEHAAVVNNEVWVANIRLAGATRTNRLMRSARRLASQVTPDQLSDDLSTIADMPYDIKALASISNRILVVVGSHGVDIFDVSAGALVKKDEVAGVGTDATYSVTEMTEGGVGNIVKGVIYKDTEGNIRLCDGYGAQIISDPIFDDHDASNRGVEYLGNNYTAQFIYLQHYRKLILAYGTQIFVLDLKRGLRDFYDWRFSKSVDALCVGVDGELFFTDGVEIYVYPQAGSSDTPDPRWRSQDITFPDDVRLVALKAWMDYLCNWGSDPALKPYVYKDTTEVAATNSLAKHTTQQRDMTGFAFGTAALREMAFGFKTTTPANITSLEVDRIAVQTIAKKRRPQ